MDKNLATKIRENREDAGHDIKDSTLKIYVANIKKLSKKLNDGVETGGAAWLKDVKNVDEKLDKNDKGEPLSYTTKRNYFNSIIIYLNALNSDKKYDDNTKFNLSYSMLKKASSMKYFKPCFKRYLTSNVRSRFARVPAPEWEIATFLPTQDFQKSSASSVYSDSRRMI